MSLYQKLKLLMRASAEEPVRKLVEINDIKIFEQEIFEVEHTIKSAKLHLANVKAEAKSLSNSIKELKSRTGLLEQQTLQAMEKDEALSNDLAALIAEDEIIIQEQQKHLQHLNKLETRLMGDLKTAVRSIQSHQRQVQIIKANQHNLKGSQCLSQKTQSLNGTLRDLNDSLNNINQRQLRAGYLDEAEGEIETTLSGSNLDHRLEASGIRSGHHDAKAVLDRLRLLKSA
ncbi:MAG: phage shock protein A [Oleiphilaceae bacterium]|jgi:phage shock protein A